MRRRVQETTYTPLTKTLPDIFYTPQGALFIQGPLSPREFASLDMDLGLHKFRTPAAQYQTLLKIASLPEGRVFVICSGKNIVGYVTFHLPEFPRWANCGVEGLIELGGIEVSENWRGMGLARALLNYIFTSHDFEEYIVISFETYCSWDLKESGLNVWQYGRMLEHLLQKVGFQRRLTDDPEVADHPANMLTVRLGSRVKTQTRQHFEETLFLQKNVN